MSRRAFQRFLSPPAMIGQQQFKVTEWDWFKLQVRLFALERRGPLFVTMYIFSDSDEEEQRVGRDKTPIECLFWCKTTDELIEKKARRAEHLEFYVSWVSSERNRLQEILRGVPALSKELDLQNDVVFTVLHNYGMGSARVCHFHKDEVHWDMTPDQVPE